MGKKEDTIRMLKKKIKSSIYNSLLYLKFILLWLLNNFGLFYKLEWNYTADSHSLDFKVNYYVTLRKLFYFYQIFSFMYWTNNFFKFYFLTSYIFYIFWNTSLFTLQPEFYNVQYRIPFLWLLYKLLFFTYLIFQKSFTLFMDV